MGIKSKETLDTNVRHLLCFTVLLVNASALLPVRRLTAPECQQNRMYLMYLMSQNVLRDLTTWVTVRRCCCCCFGDCSFQWWGNLTTNL